MPDIGLTWEAVRSMPEVGVGTIPSRDQAVLRQRAAPEPGAGVSYPPQKLLDSISPRQIFSNLLRSGRSWRPVFLPGAALRVGRPSQPVGLMDLLTEGPQSVGPYYRADRSRAIHGNGCHELTAAG